MHENRAKNQLPCGSNTFSGGFCQITRVIPGSPSKNTHVNGYKSFSPVSLYFIPIQEKNVPHLVIPVKAKTQEKRERKTICGCRIYKLTCWDWY